MSGSSPALGMIWAQARDGVIGRDGDIPWHLPEDLAHFRRVTHGDAVIMGRTSWDALPKGYRPLPGRRNIVLSRLPGFVAPGAEVVSSLEAALARVAGEPAWICGGATVYAEAMPTADLLVVTDVDVTVSGDAFAPAIGPDWTLVRREPSDGWWTGRGGLPYRFSWYERAAAVDDDEAQRTNTR
jgi:dihydrofolate reductase